MCTFNGQAIESTHSMTNPLNVYIQWLSTFNTTYIYVWHVRKSNPSEFQFLSSESPIGFYGVRKSNPAIE